MRRLVIGLGLAFMTLFLFVPLAAVFAEALNKGLALYWRALTESEALAALRLDLLHAGPDLDGDAYGHAIIGRTLLANPTDLRQHWVWLPLWHFCYAGLHLLGGGLQAMRKIDVALSSLQPLLLVAALAPAKKRDSSPELSTGEILGSGASPGRDDVRALAVRCLAPLLLLLFPFAIEHGQTGEPEPLFAALLLGAVVLVDRPGLGGHLLAAVLLMLTFTAPDRKSVV